jgi:CARDB
VGLPFYAVMTRPLLATIGTVLLAASLAGGAGGGREAARPDLVEASLSLSKHMVRQGGLLKTTDAVRNRGLGAAPRSAVGYYLSRDRVKGPGDTRLGRRAIASLPPSWVATGWRRVVIPRGTALGRYRVLACADDRHQVRESLETNNCRSTTRALVVTRAEDTTPPSFAGLVKATTCIPGPVGPGRSSPYHLSWSAARDAVTPADAIVYDVYQATSPGGESFSTATYTTPAGATAFTTPPLASTETYYFVVRARDRAGNRDPNRVERAGENLCVVR